MRPTAAALRETLFNLLGGEVRECAFLDLCAGSGSVGIEALSRGARRCVFVDSHPAAISLIGRNLEALSLGELERRGEIFDAAFLDPPYDSEVIARCLPSPGWTAIMRARGTIFVEHRRTLQLPDLAGWEEADRRRFGETVLNVFRRTGGK